jgi:hypothetical protein
MPLRPPPPRVLVGTAIFLIFVGFYLKFSPRTPSYPTPSPAFSWFGQPIPTVPPLAKVTAESDRDHYYLGENPIIRLTVENRGRLPFQIYTGGDSRGGTRSDRIKISVRDSSGNLLPDPMPVQMNMGGIGGIPILQPGDRQTLVTALMRHALVEKPGTYSIEISHDFGWHPTPARPIPVARLKLRFSEPDAAKARSIAARAGTPHRLPWEETLSDNFGDYTSLRHPIYLPLLAPQATSGTVFALLGIGHIKGPQATAALLSLALNSTSTPEVRLTAFALLADRAPYPPSITHYSPRLVISTDHLRDGAWTDALRADTLRLAREQLATDSDLTPSAIGLISALGTPEDTATVLTILDKSLTDSPSIAGKYLYPSLQALQSLHLKGWPLPLNPVRPSEVYFTFHLVERDQLPHSARIEQLALAHLATPSLILRRAAYDSLRHPVPEDQRAQVRDELAQPVVWGLRGTVLGHLRRTRDTRLLPEVLTLLETNRDASHQVTLINTALALAGPRKVIPLLITQLNQPTLARETLDELIRLTISSPPSNFRQVTWTESDLDALQSAWREFYARHEDRIVAGEKFPDNDRRVPATLFGGRYDWLPRPSL